MGIKDRQPGRPRDDDSVDELIRRRFRSCETLPMFPEPPPRSPRGFFQLGDIGAQLRLIPVREAGSPSGELSPR